MNNKAGKGSNPLQDVQALESLAIDELSSLLRSGGLKPAEKLKALDTLGKLLDRRAARSGECELTSDVLAWAAARGVGDGAVSDSPFGAGVLAFGDCDQVPVIPI